jgi:uncharacterized protein Smg (DUF494 family)
MKNLYYLLVFLISFASFSQSRIIEITNVNKGNIKIFKENQRIKIRTLDGKKHVGNLKFSDNQTLIINNQSIVIDSVQSIKKQPIVLGTVKTVLLFTGITVLGTSVIVASGGGNSAFLLFTIGTGTTISSGLIESINASNSYKKWTFKIIEK